MNIADADHEDQQSKEGVFDNQEIEVLEKVNNKLQGIPKSFRTTAT